MKLLPEACLCERASISNDEEILSIPGGQVGGSNLAAYFLCKLHAAISAATLFPPASLIAPVELADDRELIRGASTVRGQSGNHEI